MKKRMSKQIKEKLLKHDVILDSEKWNVLPTTNEEKARVM